MPTIDINTTQNVTINYDLADVKDRFTAFFIDLVLVSFISFIAIMSIVSTFRESINDGLVGRLLALLPIACFIFYHFLWEFFSNGKSLGKKIIGTKVVKLNGDQPSLSDYLMRSVFHIIDSILTLGMWAGIMINSSPQRQRLGDYAANTVVIKNISSKALSLDNILRIDSLEAYQVRYPQITSLSEKDMLLIKSTMYRYFSQKNHAHAQALVELVKHLQEVLEIQEIPKDRIEFLRVLLRDYIVLTR